MWSYYGSKTNLVGMYPKPVHYLIIEPFAGAAKYSLRYFDRDVILYDKNQTIIDIWNYLQQASERDILSLPKHLKEGTLISDLSLSEIERKLMGFVVACGGERPRNKVPKRKSTDRPNHINYNLNKIAKQLFKIRHWKFECGTYEDIPNAEATWFIDPPYQFGGECYPCGAKDINFNHLSFWSKERVGQVIVCENTKADWMDFMPMVKQRGSVHTTTEAIWTNQPTSFNAIQNLLF